MYFESSGYPGNCSESVVLALFKLLSEFYPLFLELFRMYWGVDRVMLGVVRGVVFVVWGSGRAVLNVIRINRGLFRAMRGVGPVVPGVYLGNRIISALLALFWAAI